MYGKCILHLEHECTIRNQCECLYMFLFSRKEVVLPSCQICELAGWDWVWRGLGEEHQACSSFLVQNKMSLTNSRVEMMMMMMMMEVVMTAWYLKWLDSKNPRKNAVFKIFEAILEATVGMGLSSGASTSYRVFILDVSPVQPLTASDLAQLSPQWSIMQRPVSVAG